MRRNWEEALSERVYATSVGHDRISLKHKTDDARALESLALAGHVPRAPFVQVILQVVADKELDENGGEAELGALGKAGGGSGGALASAESTEGPVSPRGLAAQRAACCRMPPWLMGDSRPAKSQAQAERVRVTLQVVDFGGLGAPHGADLSREVRRWK